MRLYHFTCDDHGLPGILATGRIQPRRQILLPEAGPIIWLTDLNQVHIPELLGLQSSSIRCNRLDNRFTVEPRYAIPWREFVAVHRLDPFVVADLEFERTPEHWWVTPQPIRHWTHDRMHGAAT